MSLASYKALVLLTVSDWEGELRDFVCVCETKPAGVCVCVCVCVCVSVCVCVGEPCEERKSLEREKEWEQEHKSVFVCVETCMFMCAVNVCVGYDVWHHLFVSRTRLYENVSLNGPWRMMWAEWKVDAVHALGEFKSIIEVNGLGFKCFLQLSDMNTHQTTKLQ